MRRFFLILFSVILLFCSCSSDEPRVFTELRMDTVCSITVYTKEDESLVPGAFDIIADISSLIDMYDSSSEISYINENAASFPVAVSDELFSLISKAYSVTEYTDGAFNLAIGPLVSLWQIGTEDAHRPSEEEIRNTLPLLDWHNIVLDEEAMTVSFLQEGMKIDLGGVGKGYVADALAAYFRENGTKSAIINLGGNVYVIGSRTDGKPWTVGLQDPESSRGGYYTTLKCSDTSIVTSGGYERYFVDEDGTVYHHILDSRTGYPASSDLISTSIISPDSTLADMLSTACYVMGREKGEQTVRHYGVSAVFLTDENEEVRIGI